MNITVGHISFQRTFFVIIAFLVVCFGSGSSSFPTVVDKNQIAIIPDSKLKSSADYQQRNDGDIRKTDAGSREESLEFNEIIGDLKEVEDYSDANPNSDSKINRSPCLLGISYDYMLTWIHPNGSLVKHLERDGINNISLFDFSNNLTDENEVFGKTKEMFDILGPDQFIAFSAAQAGLRFVPQKALKIVAKTLNFLSLRGNNFSFNVNDDIWSTFPVLKKLKQLDLINCSIDYLDEETFRNVPNLEYLYLAYNRISRIPANAFDVFNKLKHLDLSFIDSTTAVEMGSLDSKVDPYFRVIEGIDVEHETFKNLKHLEFLDFSHSKMTPYSARTFSDMSKSLKYLSLCYTSLPVIPKGMFFNTSLKALDISGNPSAALDLSKESFEGFEDTLEILSVERATIKNLHWVKDLRSVKVLKLAGNNINILTNDTFDNLKDLQLIDLSSNHIGNWYYRVFEKNKNLIVLNLRDNNINMVSIEMYKDFSDLNYLALGKNYYICNCILRDFIEIAARNNKDINCTKHVKERLNFDDNGIKKGSRRIFKTTSLIEEPNLTVPYRIASKLIDDYIPILNKSYNSMQDMKNKYHLRNIKLYHKNNNEQKQNRISDIGLPDSCQMVEEEPRNTSDSGYPTLSAGEELRFRFQLLDYNDKDYWCVNSTTNIEYQFLELERCRPDSIEETVNKISNIIYYVVISVVVAVGLFIVSAILYYKWWYIRYFCIVLKNSTILSFLDKQKGKTNEDNNNRSFMYDIFVSYCDENREWVLQELLPNLEKGREITMCLHERDFQVGLSILENIIFCMDRSRCLMLIVSKNFLESQWCQFEMHLAQHRLLETRKEHLILVLLEDIPKHQRPKTLHYLMKIKTYIKWPTGENTKAVAEERKLFWNRLRKSLLSVEWDTDEN